MEQIKQNKMAIYPIKKLFYRLFALHNARSLRRL